MELHELPKGVEYEELGPEGQEAADKATTDAIRYGEMLFQIAKHADGRPPVIATALIFAIMRCAVEAGRTKEAAKRLCTETAKKLSGGDFDKALDVLWEDFGTEEPEPEKQPAYGAKNYPL